MKTLIMFYSYTGNGKTFAQKLSEEKGADIEEVKTEKRPGTVSAYVAGSLSAIRQKPKKILPIKKNLNEYDNFVLVAPIWANSPAPAFNSVMDILPKGKNVELFLISASGNSDKEKLTSFVQGKGFNITGYHDIKQRDIVAK